MNEHHLSKRLTEVASLIPLGCRLADIGSDHAYLPVHLLIQGKICAAIAGEVNIGPLELANRQVEKHGLQGVVDVRLGDGLEVIEADEVDVVCIAGMGGPLICQILSAGENKLHHAKRLILQPNVAGNLVRDWLVEHDWELKYESVIEEEGKFYEILMAEPGDALLPYQIYSTERKREIARLMGPFLLEDPSPAFIEKWEAEIEKRKKILPALEQSEGLEKEVRERQILDEISKIEEGLNR